MGPSFDAKYVFALWRVSQAARPAPASLSINPRQRLGNSAQEAGAVDVRRDDHARRKAGDPDFQSGIPILGLGRRDTESELGGAKRVDQDWRARKHPSRRLAWKAGVAAVGADLVRASRQPRLPRQFAGACESAVGIRLYLVGADYGPIVDIDHRKPIGRKPKASHGESGARDRVCDT
jgi:hypothetical protein